jgi:hypothetical protein
VPLVCVCSPARAGPALKRFFTQICHIAKRNYPLLLGADRAVLTLLYVKRSGPRASPTLTLETSALRSPSSCAHVTSPLTLPSLCSARAWVHAPPHTAVTINASVLHHPSLSFGCAALPVYCILARDACQCAFHAADRFAACSRSARSSG